MEVCICSVPDAPSHPDTAWGLWSLGWGHVGLGTALLVRRDKGCDPGVQPKVVLPSPRHQGVPIPACLKINFRD